MSTIKIKENKTEYALVTGASSGIGLHLARELAKKGYNIIAVSNQTALLDKMKIEFVKELDVDILTINYDLNRKEAANYIFEFCQKMDISIEVLVNNAGVLVYGEIVDIEINSVENILNLHMTTAVLLCRLFGSQMIENKRGYILNVSSISAVMPYPLISLYGPTKTFVRKFSKALHIEMKRHRVHVTCLLPGATNTPLYDKDKVNIALAMRLGVMKNPDYVARLGIQALFKNKKELVPGFGNKLIVFLVPLIPDIVIAYLFKTYIQKTDKMKVKKPNEKV